MIFITIFFPPWLYVCVFGSDFVRTYFLWLHCVFITFVILSSVRPCGMLQFYSIFSVFFLYLPFFWFVYCYMCWYFSVSWWIVCNFIAGWTKYPLNAAISLHFFVVCEICEVHYLWKSQFCHIIYFMERERESNLLLIPWKTFQLMLFMWKCWFRNCSLNLCSYMSWKNDGLKIVIMNFLTNWVTFSVSC